MFKDDCPCTAYCSRRYSAPVREGVIISLRWAAVIMGSSTFMVLILCSI